MAVARRGFVCTVRCEKDSRCCWRCRGTKPQERRRPVNGWRSGGSLQSEFRLRRAASARVMARFFGSGSTECGPSGCGSRSPGARWHPLGSGAPMSSDICAGIAGVGSGPVQSQRRGGSEEAPSLRADDPFDELGRKTAKRKTSRPQRGLPTEGRRGRANQYRTTFRGYKTLRSGRTSRELG